MSVEPIHFLSALMLVFLVMRAREYVRELIHADREFKRKRQERIEALTSSEL